MKWHQVTRAKTYFQRGHQYSPHAIVQSRLWLNNLRSALHKGLLLSPVFKWGHRAKSKAIHSLLIWIVLNTSLRLNTYNSAQTYGRDKLVLKKKGSYLGLIHRELQLFHANHRVVRRNIFRVMVKYMKEGRKKELKSLLWS